MICLINLLTLLLPPAPFPLHALTSYLVFILCEENGMSIPFSKESLTYYVVEVVGEGERWRAIKQCLNPQLRSQVQEARYS